MQPQQLKLSQLQEWKDWSISLQARKIKRSRMQERLQDQTDNHLSHLHLQFVASVPLPSGILTVSLISGKTGTMQKITPFLWFDGNAEEAMQFYTSIFKNSSIGHVSRYGEAGPGPKGTVMTATFNLDGQEFMALNGGPMFNFTEAISFYVNCQTQEEVDELWDKLSEGGVKQRCGWVKDKFGLSWQIIPSILGELLRDKDPEKSGKVMNAMLQMDKIDISLLMKAYGQS